MQKNKILIIFGVIVLATLAIILRSSNNGAEGLKSEGSEKNQVVGKDFKSHVKSANKFWELIESGRDYRELGKYEQALENFKEAHDTYAFGNIEKPIALVHAAETYEMMQRFEEAAILFEEASSIAMHETNREKYRKRAKELRQKAGLPASE